MTSNQLWEVRQTGDDRYTVTADSRTFGEYVYDTKLNKPYFGAVLDREGNPFTRLDFTTKEHPHHRSVFVAIGDINGVDLWNEPADCGVIRTVKIDHVKSAGAYASFTAHNCWYDHGMTPLLDETTTYTVSDNGESSDVLDMTITLTASYGDVVFGATKEAGPLGIRVRDELRADTGSGIIHNAEGGTGEEECWGKSSRWCDYAGEVEGVGPMGITVFDHPDNERWPTAWHVRNYGLFAANNLYFKGGYTLKKGESVTYRFRILFRRVLMTAEKIEAQYTEYITEKV